MNLEALRAKEERIAVGLMSGTSCDGVDAALVSLRGSGPDTRIRLIDFQTLPYDSDTRRRLLDPDMSVQEVCLLNFLLGRKMADAALVMKELARSKGIEPDFIASHGHTVAHVPPGRAGEEIGTLQIGEPAVIAERTGLWVVSDFRPRDMAAGGQGAPLVPHADWILFQEKDRITLCLNIGGIANLTVVAPERDDVIAFDTGPGNMVIDGAVRMLTEGAMEMDEDGRIASSGRVIHDLLEKLLDHPFFDLAPPKSTGREQFGPKIFLAAALQEYEDHPLEDIVATMSALVARSIRNAVSRFVEPRGGPSRLVVSGGGAFNKTLLNLLAAELPKIKVHTSESFGLRSDAKEAVAFAILGNETLCGLPANVPRATGARHPAILGKVTPP